MTERFSIVKKGYDPMEVDSYVETIEEVLKSYKDKDAAIKNALVNAQIAADNVMKNAEIEADRIQGRAIKFMDDLVDIVYNQRQMLKAFQDEYSRMMQKYLGGLGEREIMAAYAKLDELETFIGRVQQYNDEPSNPDGDAE